MPAVVWFLVVLLACGAPARGALEAWFAPSAVKVLRDARPAQGARRCELAAARNEGEACQLVLLADRLQVGVQVTVTDLRRAGGGSLWPELRQVAYVPVTEQEVPYPDPLPPLRPLRLHAGQAQPVWVSVRVPAEAAPGLYEGSLLVKAAGARLELPLAVRVWDFALPATPTCTTAFGISDGHVARCHGVTAGSAEAKALYAAYYEMLLDHKVSPYSLPVEVTSPEAGRYLDDPRMTSYLIPYSEDDAELRQRIAALQVGGRFAKGYFYPLDEPVTKEAYDRLLAMAARLRRLEPRYRLVTPFFRNPDWDGKLTAYDLLTGVDTIWCPNEHFLDLHAKTRPILAARKQAGEDIWWYVCCGPGAPYNNFFVDMPALAHRTLFWNQKREGVEGLLYWSTTWWNPDAGARDPWTDMATVKDINPHIYGDGSLLYPGKKVGVDGPVSSQRLEVIRDGLEDFDYLTLADQRLGPGAGAAWAAKIGRSLTDWERDPAVLERVRRELGDALEQATVAARRRL